jgi:cobalt/nickel transport protein
MRSATQLILGLALLGLASGPARAHFHMLLPQTPAARKGETVLLSCQWGHPFEHELFDTALPESIFVVTPDGKKTDLARGLEKVMVPGAEQKQVTAQRLRFTPEQRGDHVFAVTMPPVWMEEEKEFFEDTVKVVLHVQAQNGWEQDAGLAMEMRPLTRPYGLQPGMVFQAQAVLRGKPLAGALAEIERYNPTPPKQLPPDEQITRTARTDPNGVMTATLTEAGWWCLTVQTDNGTKEHEGKAYPVHSRCTLWVWVDEKGTPK